MAKQQLLLVDDDARALRVLEVSLRNAGFSVTTASNGAEAISKATRARPALIVSDTHMPVLDGYGLCKELRANEPFKDIPFIFLTDRTAIEDKIRGLELGVDDYLTKPIYIKEVITRVQIALQKYERASLEKKDKRRFFGALEDMSLVDLLQTIELGRKTGIISFERESQTGRMWFVDGRVVDAEAGHLSGPEAVYRLLTWNVGVFEIDFRPIDRPHHIDSSTQALVMEGMRRVDEWGRMVEQLPSIDAVFQVDFGELAERLNDLPETVANLLRLFDGRRTALQAIGDSDLPDLEALSAVSRLYFEGVVYEVTEAQPLPTDPMHTPPAAVDGSPVSASPGLGADAWGTAGEEPHRERGAQSDTFEAERGLVDDLLTSATSVAEHSRPIRESDTPRPTGALPPILSSHGSPVSARPEPAGDTRQGDPSDPLAPDEPKTDVETVRHALKLGLDELLGDDDDEAMLPSDEDFGLGEPDAAAGPSASGARQAQPDPAVAEHDHEMAFFDQNTAHPRSEEDSLNLGEVPREPVSKAAYIAVGLFAAAVLGLVGFLTLRDVVEPYRATSGSLNTGWHKDQLKERATPPAAPPIDASWRIFPESDAGIPPVAAIADDERAPETIPVKPPKKQAGSAVANLAPAPTEQSNAQVKRLLQEGKSLSRNEEFRAAVKVYKKALSLSPNSVAALVAMAEASMELDLNRDALRALKKATKVSPRNAQSHLLHGTVLQLLNRKEEAVEAYNRYLSLAPKGDNAQDVRRILESWRRN